MLTRSFQRCKVIFTILVALLLFTIYDPIKLSYQKFFKPDGEPNLSTNKLPNSILNATYKEWIEPGKRQQTSFEGERTTTMWSLESSDLDQSMRDSTSPTILTGNEASHTTTETKQTEYCTISSSEFHGRIKIDMTQIDMAELERKYHYLKPGGHYIPQECKARSSIAVVVPFRDREAHLKILLNHMHYFLTKQKLDYSIIVVEQIDQTFNRAKLLNIGFVEALKLYGWQCFLFHDVDVLPEDDRNLHYCPIKNPRHMAVALNKFGYKLVYNTMFGTSSALTVEQFRKVNGFSNRYWGWGGEDDDMYTRVKLHGYEVERYNDTIARYTMLSHSRDKANPINPCRYKLLERTKDDWNIDGLNSLAYKVVNITIKPLFTHILVDLFENVEKEHIKKFCE
ncbi:hypothetical protein KIN20_007017 [Parelaphostrongylus tenuis]|uniref:Beta-1,4-N-acetylgalactosaminyltransferase n=1 Tax=Parelaphostrongylus tenuis TaxID=148309 RepID=A0AAD5MUX1_PARTN|nr:hypothetical protein KIN20_007017 [Parelaphostrongylus tenuis]